MKRYDSETVNWTPVLPADKAASPECEPLRGVVEGCCEMIAHGHDLLNGITLTLEGPTPEPPANPAAPDLPALLDRACEVRAGLMTLIKRLEYVRSLLG